MSIPLPYRFATLQTQGLPDAFDSSGDRMGKATPGSYLDANFDRLSQIITVSSTAPAPSYAGQLWYNLTNQTLYVWNGSYWAAATSIADGSVTTDKLANGAVTGPKIATGAVQSSNLADSAVTTSKIADHAVTQEKLAEGVGGGGSGLPVVASATIAQNTESCTLSVNFQQHEFYQIFLNLYNAAGAAYPSYYRIYVQTDYLNSNYVCTNVSGSSLTGPVIGYLGGGEYGTVLVQATIGSDQKFRYLAQASRAEPGGGGIGIYSGYRITASASITTVTIYSDGGQRLGAGSKIIIARLV